MLSTLATSVALWSVLGLVFAGAPPEHPSPPVVEASPEATAALVELEDAVNDAAPTEESARRLTEALERSLAEGLELVDNPDALDLHDRARLVLVSIYLAAGNEAQAERAMDEAIRSAMGRDIGAGRFGPVVLELHERRLEALTAAGTGTIAITCEDCEVFVNEARLSDPAAPLFLGTHRVWVVFSDSDRAPERIDLDLDLPGAVASHRFTTALTPPAPTDEAPRTKRRRLYPRWVELLGLSAGAASLVSGVMLTAIHDKCRGAPFTGDLETCETVYFNRPQGPILIGLGATVMAAAGITLTYDELRVGPRRDRRAMMTWTLRF